MLRNERQRRSQKLQFVVGILSIAVTVAISAWSIDGDPPKIEYTVKYVERTSAYVELGVRVTASESQWHRESGVKSITIADKVCSSPESGARMLVCEFWLEASACVGEIDFSVRSDDVNGNFRNYSFMELIPSPKEGSRQTACATSGETDREASGGTLPGIVVILAGPTGGS